MINENTANFVLQPSKTKMVDHYDLKIKEMNDVNEGGDDVMFCANPEKRKTFVKWAKS
jgi:hypothetical protein